MQSCSPYCFFPTRRFLAAGIGLLLGTAAPTTYAALVSLDFESGNTTTNQFTSNFRLIFSPAGNNAQSDPTDSGGPNNDFAFYERTGGSTANGSTLLYDTTPSNSGDAGQTFSGPITISLDLAAVNNTSGIGIYLVDPANMANSIGIFAQINGSGTNERITYRSDADFSTGTSGTQLGTNQDGDGGIGTSSHTSPTFATLTLTYTPGVTFDTLAASFGSLNATSFQLFDADRLGVSSFLLALRLNDTSTSGSTSVKFDNFTVVPEPAPIALLSAFGLMMLLRRPKRLS